MIMSATGLFSIITGMLSGCAAIEGKEGVVAGVGVLIIIVFGISSYLTGRYDERSKNE